jgi:hypothetical protein
MNIMGRLVMRPPILLVRSCFIIFLRVPLVSYREAFWVGPPEIPALGTPCRVVETWGVDRVVARIGCT